jgi:hypothetical protein
LSRTVAVIAAVSRLASMTAFNLRLLLPLGAAQIVTAVVEFVSAAADPGVKVTPRMST